MSTITLTSEEQTVLINVLAHFEAGADADTSHAITKIKSGTEVELTNLERIGLSSVLQSSIVMAEVSEDANEDNVKILKGLVARLN